MWSESQRLSGYWTVTFMYYLKFCYWQVNNCLLVSWYSLHISKTFAVNGKYGNFYVDNMHAGACTHGNQNRNPSNDILIYLSHFLWVSFVLDQISHSFQITIILPFWKPFVMTSKIPSWVSPAKLYSPLKLRCLFSTSIIFIWIQLLWRRLCCYPSMFMFIQKVFPFSLL